MIYSGLVLIGSANKVSEKTETFGTGVLLEYCNNIYIVTCKHIFLETNNMGSLFAIPILKKTLNPRNGYSVLKLDMPYSHKEDNTDSTYDIVVFKVCNQKDDLYKECIKPIILSEEYFKDNPVNEYYAASYPVDYVEKNLKENSEEILYPKELIGKLELINIDQIDQKGFSGKLKEGKFLRIEEAESMGKGSSGGLIYYINKINEIVPIGIILGFVDVMITNLDGSRGKIYGIVFANILRALEIIKTI